MSGVLLINKPAGITSHDVVLRIRKIFHTRKVGHAGTLDPFATGLLLLCLDEATRVAEYLVGREKEYVGVMRLGETTDTQDCTGRVLETKPVPGFRHHEIERTFERFVGEFSQIPPMFSARKVKGTRLYTLARQGQTVERPARQVVIHELEILEIAVPDIRFRVVCSKGTYIRTLAYDIGNALGCGAHLRVLKRTRIGAFALSNAISLEELQAMPRQADNAAHLIPIDRALSFLPAITISDEAAGKLMHGTAVPLPAEYEEDCPSIDEDPVKEKMYRIYSASGAFLALAKKRSAPPPDKRRWRIQPVKVFGDF